MSETGLAWLSLLPGNVVVPPSAVFIVAGIAILLLGDGRLRQRQVVMIATVLLGTVNLLSLKSGLSLGWSVLDLQLVHLHVDRLSFLFGLLFHIGALIAVVYALNVRSALVHAAGMVYAGCSLGAVFAGDLVTLFFYWEGMALGSVFLIWSRREQQAVGAGLRYLALQLASGLLLLAGLIARYQATGELRFDYLGTDDWSGWLILAAFGIKCGFPLVHSWIVDGYPSSTPEGTVFLSVFTTKVAVYALARGFPGTEVLVPVGTLMALFPIFYAVIENDLRRVLAYSMVNQIGFMVAGIGIGTELALNGAVAHAFNEVLFKGLLFMSMGAVLHRVGHVLGSDLGGLYRSMPLTAGLCIVGAASISAFPLFSGFVSKSLIMAAMLDAGHGWYWLALLFASAGVFHHAGIKIPYFAFFAHDSGLRVREAPANMLLAMGIAAAGCLLIGCYPAMLYSLLPWEASYSPYTYAHVLAQLQLLFFSALAFVWLQLTGIYPSELRSVNLDADWLYRRGIPRGFEKLSAAAGNVGSLSRAAASAVYRRLTEEERSPRREVSALAGSGAGTLVVWSLLCVFLLYSYWNG